MPAASWTDRLHAAVEQSAAPMALAFSGGLDSTVLLHVLANMPTARSRGLRALHVDHGLHAGSAEWERHCASVCEDLQLPYRGMRVDVDRRGSLEAAARESRYAALAGALLPGEWLLTAQHRDDQVETVLLRLLRGAGSAGLAGMREARLLAGHQLWRPLLDVPRAELEDYARAHRLDWLDDPSNRDQRHRRNLLRHAVLPLLREHWPQVDSALAASAHRLAEDADLVAQMALQALADCRGLDPASLRIPPLRQLPDALMRHVLRQWTASLGCAPVPASVLERVRDELMDAAGDASPRLAWQHAELRRYRDMLVCRLDPRPVEAGWSLDWDGSGPLRLPSPFGELRLLPAGSPLPAMRVRPRAGGERIALAGRPRQSLQHALQALGIPPWERERLPLLFDAADGELLAAGDLLLSARWQARLDASGRWLRWQPA